MRTRFIGTIIQTASFIAFLSLALSSCGLSTPSTSSTRIPNDPLYPEQWYLPAIRAPQAWTSITGSESTRIGVIDTGIAPLADLNPNLVPGVQCDPTCHSSSPNDPEGHGTSIASLLGSVGNNDYELSGVAWKVGIVPIQVTDNAGNLSISGIENAVKWSAENKIRIVNMSLVLSGENASISQAMRAAEDTLFIVPSGNDGLDVDSQQLPVFPCTDDAPNILCVGSITPGLSVDDRANTGRLSVDLAAPGTKLLTSDRLGRTIYVDGTSYATAQVAGAAGLLLTRDPDLSIPELKAALITSAQKTPETNNRFLGGILDVESALKSLDSLQ